MTKLKLYIMEKEESIQKRMLEQFVIHKEKVEPSNHIIQKCTLKLAGENTQEFLITWGWVKIVLKNIKMQ